MSRFRFVPLRHPRAFATALLSVFATLALAQTYTAWRGAEFTSAELADSTISGPVADPDHDGLSNLQEFVFVGAPKLTDTGIAPTLEFVADTLALTYRERHDLATSGVRVNLEVSDTLFHWVTPNTVVEADREAFAAEGFDLVTLLDPLPFSSSSQRRFLRLRVDASTPSSALKAPTLPALSALSPTTYELRWNDWNFTETGHQIERLSPATALWESVGTSAADTAAWQHTAADYRDGFTYRVAALRASDGASAASVSVSLPDSDLDGIPDPFELGTGYFGAAGTYSTFPDSFSSGESGVSDAWALEHGFDPFNHDFATDTDADGLSDYEEALRGSDPRSVDTDGDGAWDDADGWPRQSWITAAPLPEVSYAVVPLRSLGFPASAKAIQLDDAGNVLGLPQAGFDLVLWLADQSQVVTPPLQLSSTQLVNRPDDNPVLGFGHFSMNLLQENLGLFAPPHARVLSRGGYLAGAVLDEAEIPHAAIWKVGDANATVFPEPQPEGVIGTVSLAFTVNSLGAGAGWRSIKTFTSSEELSRDGGFSLADGNWLPPGPLEMQAPGFAGQLVLPAEMNDAGQILVQTYAAEDVGPFLEWSAPLANNRAAIIDSGVVHDLGAGTARTFSSSSPAVAVGLATDASATPWWAHREGAAWVRETLHVWDRKKAALVAPSYFSNYTATVNSRFEFLSVRELVRDGELLTLDDFLPVDWALSAAKDINNHGVILAEAKKTFDEQGLPIPTTQQVEEPVLLVPFDIVRKDEDGYYVSAENVPVMQAGDGVGRGKVSSPDAPSKVFTLEIQPLTDQAPDVVFFEQDSGPVELSETASSSQIFESANGRIRIALLSPPEYGHTGATFLIDYSNQDSGTANESVAMVESEEPGIFRTLYVTLWLTVDPASSTHIEAVFSSSEIPATVTADFTEDPAVPGRYVSGSTIITFPQPLALSSSAPDVIDVILTAPDIVVGHIPLRLAETSADSRELTNAVMTSVVYSDEPVRVPSETTEVFRIRRHADTSANTFQMTVRTAVEDVLVTLTRTQGNEFISEPMIAVNAGDDVSLIPNSALYRVIQVVADAQEATDEITFIDNTMNLALAAKNMIRTAYIAHGFSTDPEQKLEKAAGEKFVDEWKVGVPEKLGWSLTDGAADYGSTKTRFIAAAAKSGFLAWFGHGQYSRDPMEFIGLDMFRVPGLKSSNATMVTGDSLATGLNYDFVFINACGSATPGNPAADALITRFNSKLYIGWDNLVNVLGAAKYAQGMLNKLDTNQTLSFVSDQSWDSVEPILKWAPGDPALRWRADQSSEDMAKFRLNKK